MKDSTKIAKTAATAFLGALAAGGLTSNSKADPIADFYTGKTINFYIGYSPGGTYDLYARLLSRFMGDHIPGRPRIIPINMPGGGSRIAAGYVYSIAPRDGTALGTADQALAVEQAMGDATIKFDTSKLSFIGAPIVVNNVTVTWSASGVKSVADAQQRQVTMGATGGSSSSQYPAIMNALLATKFKIVLGYPGGPDINLAMERGEVDGRGSNDWVSWKATKPEWIRDKKINILDQVGLQKEPDLPGVPLLTDLARNSEDRAVLALLSAEVGFGRPVFAGPGVPADRLAALRKAFDETVSDKAFLAEAASQRLDVRPVSGQSLQDLVNTIISHTPRDVGQKLASIVNQ